MPETLQSKNAHDMCISVCSFFSRTGVRGGCLNKSIFIASTSADIAEARKGMALGIGCNQASHLGDSGSMVFDDTSNQWIFVPDGSK